MECVFKMQAHPSRTRSVGALVDVNAYGHRTRQGRCWCAASSGSQVAHLFEIGNPARAGRAPVPAVVCASRTSRRIHSGDGAQGEYQRVWTRAAQRLILQSKPGIDGSASLNRRSNRQ